MALGRLSISSTRTTSRRDGARGATVDRARRRAESRCIPLREARQASRSTNGCPRRVKPQLAV